MASPTYEPKITALLCVDFYNDFLSEGGKLWPWVKDVAQEVNLLDNLRSIAHTARDAGITVYHVPHHRWSQVITSIGNIRLPTSSARPSVRLSPRAHGAAPFTTISKCRKATSS
jgi:nicotinamidase-related amidase